jgi:hypothetical protein
MMEDTSLTTGKVLRLFLSKHGLFRVSYAGGNLTTFGKKPFLTWGFLLVHLASWPGGPEFLSF